MLPVELHDPPAPSHETPSEASGSSGGPASGGGAQQTSCAFAQLAANAGKPPGHCDPDAHAPPADVQSCDGGAASAAASTTGGGGASASSARLPSGVFAPPSFCEVGGAPLSVAGGAPASVATDAVLPPHAAAIPTPRITSTSRRSFEKKEAIGCPPSRGMDRGCRSDHAFCFFALGSFGQACIAAAAIS